MKHLKLLYALMFAVAVIACSDDDEDPTYNKADFYAEWKEDGSEEQGCVSVIKFDANSYYSGSKCGTSATDYDFDVEYTFDGKRTFTIDFFGEEAKLVITSKTATTFKADVYAAGVKADSYTYTKL